MASLLRAKHKQREPPPSLFLHPSPAASHVSLPGILAPGAGVPGASKPSRNRSDVDHSDVQQPAGLNDSLAAQRPTRTLVTVESSRSADRTDALWAEMQATLEEVELSASGGTHVFGIEHERKLADLRTAQISLAQAWARSEADDAIETNHRDIGTSGAGDELRNLKGALGDTSKPLAGEGTDGVKGTAGTNSAKGGSNSAGGAERLGAKLEEETESDIILARKRREANDQYFQRVNNGVIDVVAKLEEVAVAMRAVEQESKDMWSDDGASRTTEDV